MSTDRDRILDWLNRRCDEMIILTLDHPDSKNFVQGNPSWAHTFNILPRRTHYFRKYNLVINPPMSRVVADDQLS